MLSHSIPNIHSRQALIKNKSKESFKFHLGELYNSSSTSINIFSIVDKEFISNPMHYLAKKLRKPHIKILNALAHCSTYREIYVAQEEVARLCAWSINSRTWVSIHLGQLERMGLILKRYKSSGVYSYVLNPWFNNYRNILELNKCFQGKFPEFQKVLIYNQAAVYEKNYTPNIEYKEDNSAPIQKREKIIYQGLASKRDLLLKRLRSDSSINFRFNYPYQEALTICGMTMMFDVTIRKPKRGVPPALAVEDNDSDYESHRPFFFNEKEKGRGDVQNSVVFYRETFGSDAWAAQQLCHEDADACIAEIDDLMDAFDTPELRAFESDFESYCGSIKTVGELKAIDKDDQEFIDLIAQTPY